MDAPKYLYNAETREIYCYTEDLAKMENPKFLPFEGKLPPPDLKRGVPLAPLVAASITPGIQEHSPEQRIEIIAGVLPIVPKDEFTKKGDPAQLAVEKLSGLEKVTRAEINKATVLRAEVLAGRGVPPGAPEEGEEEEDGDIDE